MITQWLMDWFSTGMLASLLQLLPPLPQEVADLLADGSGLGAQLGTMLAKTGIVIPWATAGAIMGVWLALVGFWAIVLGVRALLWILNR